MNDRQRVLRIVWICLLLLSAISPRVWSQSGTGGSVAGQVSDSGGRLFAALVTLRNTATGSVSQMRCDRSGNFRFAELAPGAYSVRVSAPGLAAWKSDSVIVEIGRVTLLAPKLSLAYSDTLVHTKGQISQTDLSSAVANNTDQQVLDNLPNSSSHWSSSAGLSGGAVPAESGEQGGGNALSFRGLSPLMNSISLDGTDHNLAFMGRERGSGGNGYSTAQSAISEFQVNVSNFSAEFGRAAGGVVNTVTRSGTNRLHGRASFYDRDAAWGASNAFTTLTEKNAQGEYVSVPYKPADNRMLWSFSAGGPLRRDKLFWFFAYDQHRRDFPGVARANEPATFFAPPTAANIRTLAARLGQSPSAALASYNNVLGDLGGLLGSVPRTANQLILFPKIDWRPNNRNHLVFQFNLMRRTSPNGVAQQASDTYGIGSFGNSSTRSNTGIVGWEYFLTPTLLSNARYQYSSELLSQTASTSTPFEQQFANNFLGLAPQIAVDRGSGFTFGTRSSLDKPQYPDETRQQFVDAVTWVHHKHALKFGYDYNYVTDSVSGLNNQAGNYSYSSLLNFVSDALAPNHCDGTTTAAGPYPCYSYFEQSIGEPVWRFETADYAAFLADDWKLVRRFTISLGVRYEYEDLPNPNKLVVNSDIPQTGVMPHDRNNFAPRAGFAWDIFGSGHTVLRGGYGIYYGRVSNATIYSALTETGAVTAQRSYYFRPLDTGAPPFPFIFSNTSVLKVLPTAVYFDKRFQNPQVDQTELSLQQELGRRTAVTVTYLGSNAHELPNFLDTNIDLTAIGTLNYTIDDPQHLGPIKNASVASKFFYQRLNPKYGSITDIISETNASYHAAVVRFTHQMSNSIRINIGYTYAHAIDDNQNESTFADNNDVYDPTNLALEHGTSNFDVRQRAAGSIVLQTPWHLRGFAAALFSGYTVATTGEWHTGLPYTMRTTGAVPAPSCSYEQYLESGAGCVQDGNPGYILGGAGSGPRISGLGASLNGSGGNDLVPEVGRNTFRYPAITNLDVRASKSTHLTDRVTFEILGEAFNVLNHQNVTSIDTIGYTIDNDASYTDTAHLTYRAGTAGTSAFGSVTNANSTSLYRQRQIQVGCRLAF